MEKVTDIFHRNPRRYPWDKDGKQNRTACEGVNVVQKKDQAIHCKVDQKENTDDGKVHSMPIITGYFKRQLPTPLVIPEEEKDDDEKYDVGFDTLKKEISDLGEVMRKNDEKFQERMNVYKERREEMESQIRARKVVEEQQEKLKETILQIQKQLDSDLKKDVEEKKELELKKEIEREKERHEEEVRQIERNKAEAKIKLENLSKGLSSKGLPLKKTTTSRLYGKSVVKSRRDSKSSVKI